jgi:hypothetical protein
MPVGISIVYAQAFLDSLCWPYDDPSDGLKHVAEVVFNNIILLKKVAF